jgi:hypothetical protein
MRNCLGCIRDITCSSPAGVWTDGWVDVWHVERLLLFRVRGSIHFSSVCAVGGADLLKPLDYMATAASTVAVATA